MADRSPYAPPTPLVDLHILDVLELAGSQTRAGAALALHQSTVCRSVRLMQQQFRLVPQQGPAVCRHGHNRCLQHLRLAYREHRLMAGQVRIGTDPLHQQLLTGLAAVQRMPARCHSADHWAELVRHALLDGAIVSSYALPKRLLASQAPQWPDLHALPLGQLALELVAQEPASHQVLLPQTSAVPLLQQALIQAGFAVQQQPAAAQEPDAWLKRARDRQLALPVNPALVGRTWLTAHGLSRLADQPTLIEQLWLLLPTEASSSPAVRQCSRWLRRQVSQAANGG